MEETATALCFACGHPNRSGARFCAHCSQPLLQKPCPQCGYALRPGASFCSRCGHRVSAKTPAVVCSACGRSNRAEARFCLGCGQPLHQAEIACLTCGANNRATAQFCRECGHFMVRVAPHLAEQSCPQCGASNRESARYCLQCGMILAATPSGGVRYETGMLPANQTLLGSEGAEYVIIRLIARGGMGAVYRVVRTTDSTTWALKEMSERAADLGDLESTIAAFRREAEMLARLEHPNLPKVVDLFESQSRQYMVMDLIEGQTLNELAHAQGMRVTEEQVLDWAEQLCQVLSYLHSQNPPIVYRDLKPENIMVESATGRIKLIDFGIARRYKGTKSHDTLLLGTPGYAAPEQWGSQDQESEPRSDVYALGAVIHELLTGANPCDAPFTFLPVQRLNSGVSLRVSAAVMKAVEMQVEDRHQSAAAFYEALLDKPFPTDEGVSGDAKQTTTGKADVARQRIDLGRVRRGQVLHETVPVQVVGKVRARSDVAWLDARPARLTAETKELVVTAYTGELALGRRAAGQRGVLVRLLVGWLQWPGRRLVPVACEHHGVVTVGEEHVDVYVDVEPAAWRVVLARIASLGIVIAEIIAVLWLLALVFDLL